VDPTPAGVDRVPLKGGRPMLPRVLDDAVEQCAAQSKPPVSDTDCETEDRPDLHRVDLGNRPRPDQTGHLVARAEAAPSSRNVRDIRKHPGSR
jgi:hypothetical protein